MEQDIRFCEVDGRRVAYATIGEGPLLVFGAPLGHPPRGGVGDPRVRAFFEELARSHRVVRYDRLGAGSRSASCPARRRPSRRRALSRAVLDACGDEPATLFACSCAGLATSLFAREQPERVRKIVYFGGYVSRDDIPEATRRSLVDFVRVNWPLAAQMLAGLFLRTRAETRSPRSAATSAGRRTQTSPPPSSSSTSRSNLRDVPAERDGARARAAPPRRPHGADRARPRARGAAPNARFVALGGDSHLPWMDDQRELSARARRLPRRRRPGGVERRLAAEPRETEVLRLVAAGLSNREIASSLVLSEHTVHRHVANVLRKLAQSSRAAAAAHATRAGLI